jgi:hypothetical protein
MPLPVATPWSSASAAAAETRGNFTASSGGKGRVPGRIGHRRARTLARRCFLLCAYLSIKLSTFKGLDSLLKH